MKKNNLLVFILLLYVSSASAFIRSFISGLLENPITPRIAYIPITRMLSVERVGELLCEAAKNGSIHGIILLIDSYGGSAESFCVLHDMIKKVNTTYKPVIALILSAAESGGYLVASAAEYIIAHSGSSIGSIGVLSHVERLHGVKIKRHDIKGELDVEVLSCGMYKALYDPYRNELSDAERAYLKKRLNEYYTRFKEMVAHNRKISLDDSEKWAEGKCFFAREALEYNLIDEIGTIFEAESKILGLVMRRNPDCVYSSGIQEVPMNT